LDTPLFDMPTQRPRGNKTDPLWVALIEELDIRAEELTEYQRGALNKALQQLRQVNATPEEIHRRCKIYKELYPSAALTATALAKHWAECRPGRRVHKAATLDVMIDAVAARLRGEES
jgi:hypothetical protein